MNRKRNALALVGAGVLIAALAACGGDDGDSDGDSGGKAAGGEPWILGTTETVTAMDPAGSYDFGSWNMQYAIFEQLVSIPANGAEPEDDAAHCEYDDPQKITCTLKDGLKFSNGDELTSSDVLFSLKRNIEIADPNGSSVLLGSISNGDEKAPTLADGAIETPDDKTVVFNLNQPDLTFLKVLTSGTASIVDEDVFPADKIVADEDVIGSGPYTLSQYKPGEQAVLEANPEYNGERTSKASQVFVKYYSDPAPLRTDVENGQVDVAFRTLSPADLTSLEDGGKVNVLPRQGLRVPLLGLAVQQRRRQGQGDPSGRGPDHRP